MAEGSGRTLVCSILFLDIAGYSTKAVAEQQHVKEAFNSALAGALEHVATRDRVVLDTGDGAAVTFFAGPEDALLAALAFRDESSRVPVRMGINLGPVRLVRDLNGQSNIIGDGINVAQRVMGFADAGQLLVSRSFEEVVASLSKEYAALFSHKGSRSDKHGRAHELYAVGKVASAGSKGAESELQLPAQVFDAGPHLVISGYSASSVEETLKKFADRGCRVVSPLTQVGRKWLATCEHPTARLSDCKVAEMGLKRMVTGPTRAAVAAKVESLVAFGAVLVGEIECVDGEWTALCDTSS